MVGEPTAEGEWTGTWFYQNRDWRMAVWLRASEKGVPEIRFQYQSLSAPESFETDWTGRATYYLSAQPVAFEIRIDEADAAQARGTWAWTVEFPDSGRSEKGRFRMFRALHGRQLVIDFDEYEKIIRRGERVSRQTVPPGWAFGKASKRLVLWDEIPW
jgi:hypothetical protein